MRKWASHRDHFCVFLFACIKATSASCDAAIEADNSLSATKGVLSFVHL